MTEELLRQIITGGKTKAARSGSPKPIKIKETVINRFFGREQSRKEIEDTIVKALSFISLRAAKIRSRRLGRETYLADLYRQSVQALTQNRTEWMGLLSSVSKYYKMSFDKNVLIYVQRPDAGLLATKMGWEKQTGRYLKAGSKGIGVVDMNNPKATLAYYFDLADTRGDYEGFRRAMSAVWSLERQYQPEILDRFHKQFGTDENSIENCLCQLVGMQADAFLKNIFPV